MAAIGCLFLLAEADNYTAYALASNLRKSAKTSKMQRFEAPA